MAFKQGGAKTRSSYGQGAGSSRGAGGGGRGRAGSGSRSGGGRGTTKKKESDTSKNAGIYLRENDSDNTNAPQWRGFLNMTPEFIEYLTTLPINEDFGTVGLSVALWYREGDLSGQVNFFQPEPREEDGADEED